MSFVVIEAVSGPSVLSTPAGCTTNCSAVVLA